MSERLVLNSGDNRESDLQRRVVICELAVVERSSMSAWAGGTQCAWCAGSLRTARCRARQERT